MGIGKEQVDQIAKARDSQKYTRRPVSSGLEDVLHNAMPILDHGFVRVVDYMGDDSSIVQAARVSYGRGTKRRSQDRDLIRYLMQHQHTTPFEMAEIKLHVKLPIFVARQWIRHRTASVNEYSARYSVLDKEFYVPEPKSLAGQSSTNRQGRGKVLGEAEASYVLELLRDDAENAYSHYLDLLNEDSQGNRVRAEHVGLAKELARINLSVNFYTQWYWKIDLHNLMRFLQLRADPNAQYEIRSYAEVLIGILERWVPLTAEAFREFRLGAMHLSATAVSVIQQRLAGKAVRREESGLSKREWNDLVRTFEL